MPRDHNTSSERSGVGVRTKSDVVSPRLNAPPPRMGFCPHDARGISRSLPGPARPEQGPWCFREHPPRRRPGGEPSRPCFVSIARARSPPESLGMRAGSRPLYDVHCSSAENKPLTQLHRTRNNTGHYPSPAARQSWPWRLQGSRQECHRGGVGNPSHFSSI